MAPRLRSTIRKIYLYRSLIDFILLYPLYSILFAQHGLSTSKISALFMIWALTDIFTNAPMGVLADRYPRKWLLAIAPLIEVLGFVIWFILPTFTGFACGFILWGISSAMIEGTYEALLYDELKTIGSEDQYVRIAGRAQSYALIANFAATALASVAILLGYGFATSGSIAALITASLVALTLPSATRYEAAGNPHYVRALRKGFGEVFHSRVLLEVVLLGSVIGAIYATLDEYIPLFFHQVGYSRSIVSLVVAATILFQALGSFIAHHYQHLATSSFMAVLLVTGVMLICSARLLGFSAIILMVLFTFLIQMLSTIYDGKVQHAIVSNLRATVTSVSMFSIELCTAFTFLLYGIAARRDGNIAGFKLVGIIAIVTAVIYLVLTPRILTKRIEEEA